MESKANQIQEKVLRLKLETESKQAFEELYSAELLSAKMTSQNLPLEMRLETEKQKSFQLERHPTTSFTYLIYFYNKLYIYKIGSFVAD